MMTETARNLGGRPEIGGKAAPVAYGPELLAEIDRQATASSQTRAAWLRDTALARVNQSAPETLTWADMTAAGIDIDLIEKRANAADTHLPTWQATSLDGLTRIIFGVSYDAENNTQDGQHAGWDAAWYDLEDEDDGDGPVHEGYRSNEYYEPYDWRRMLADVANVAPLTKTP
jgi:hypothetical protein